jgi:hypothetical protein
MGFCADGTCADSCEEGDFEACTSFCCAPLENGEDFACAPPEYCG